MRAGQMRRKVELFQANESPDSTYGGPEDAEFPIATRFARIRLLSQGERFAAAEHFGEVTHEVAIRYDDTLFDALTSAERMKHDGRTFDIQAPANVDEAGREIQFLAKERR